MRHFTMMMTAAIIMMGCGDMVDGPRKDDVKKERFAKKDGWTKARPDIQHILDEFERKTGRRNADDVAFWWGDIGPPEGVCYKNVDTVILDKKEFSRMSEHHRRVLVWHEVGHCGLELKHIKEKFPNGEPKSIMHPFVRISEAFFEEHEHEYINQMMRMVDDGEV